MIERSSAVAGAFIIHCDFCSAVEEFETNFDWSEMISQAKDAGWRFFKEDSEWKSKCPDCMDDFIEELKEQNH